MSTITEERPVAAPAPDEEERKGGITVEAIAIIALVMAFASAIVAVFAMGLAARSIDESRAVPAGGGGGPVAVSLTEFAIAPAPLTVTSGGSLAVTNDGSTTHDLTVEDHDDVATPTLDAGGTATLDVSALAPGSYTIFCSIPGHRESGMETSITVG